MAEDFFFDSDKEQRERKEDREAELIGMRWGTAESEHTLYVCEQTSDASILKVLDGAVKFTSNVTGEEILVNAGQMATATASGLSPLESFDVEAENASWEPYLPTIEVTEPEEEAIGGIWYMGGPINEGMPCQIVQEGDTLTVINENGQQSSGRFVDSSTIEATDWENGLRGTLSVDRNRIDWANGSWWIRNNSAGGAFSRDKTNGEVIGTSEDYRVSPKASTEEIGSAEVVQSDIPKATFIDRICGWAGTWESNFGQMVLQQSGNSITGTYVHDQGRIRGTISGKKVVGTWSESPSYNSPNDAGDFEFTISDNCGSFSGNWRYGSSGGWSGGWSGTRI